MFPKLETTENLFWDLNLTSIPPLPIKSKLVNF
jgi:hypothetical protein